MTYERRCVTNIFWLGSWCAVFSFIYCVLCTIILFVCLSISFSATMLSFYLWWLLVRTCLKSNDLTMFFIFCLSSIYIFLMFTLRRSMYWIIMRNNKSNAYHNIQSCLVFNVIAEQKNLQYNYLYDICITTITCILTRNNISISCIF